MNYHQRKLDRVVSWLWKAFWFSVAVLAAGALAEWAA
jgi:hypothetical protein